MVPLPDDDELREHTEALIDVPPDVVIATTGIGFRGWVAAADGWGLTTRAASWRSAKRALFPADRRRPARCAPRACPRNGPRNPNPPASCCTTCVECGIAGQRIAVQLHGATDDWDPFPEFLDELRAAGAEVVPIRVYRWHPAPRDGDFDQLVAGIADEKFDAVSFTSAPAVASVLMRAERDGHRGQGAFAHSGPTCTRCASAR